MRIDRKAFEADIKRGFQEQQAAGEAPDPPVQKNLSTDGFARMMVDVDALFRSSLWVSGDLEALGLHCRLLALAWGQVPAGSIPGDLKELARLAGDPLRTLKRLQRDGKAFSQFVRCADGRLYHAAVCADAACTAMTRAAREEAGEVGAAARWKLRKNVVSMTVVNHVQSLISGGKRRN